LAVTTFFQGCTPFSKDQPINLLASWQFFWT
jgi:hypothetical protein